MRKGAVPGRAAGRPRPHRDPTADRRESAYSEPIVEKSARHRITWQLPGERDRPRKSVVHARRFEFRITACRDNSGHRPRPARAGVSGGRRGDPRPHRWRGCSRPTPRPRTRRPRTRRRRDSLVGGPGALSHPPVRGRSPGEYVPKRGFPRVDSDADPGNPTRGPTRARVIWGSVPRHRRAPGCTVHSTRWTAAPSSPATSWLMRPPRSTKWGRGSPPVPAHRAGGRVFGRETSRHIGDHMAIILDGRVQQSQPPVIRSQITRRADRARECGPARSAGPGARPPATLSRHRCRSSRSARWGRALAMTRFGRG